MNYTQIAEESDLEKVNLKLRSRWELITTKTTRTADQAGGFQDHVVYVLGKEPEEEDRFR